MMSAQEKEAAQKKAWGVVDDLTSAIAKESFENSFYIAKQKNKKTRVKQVLLACRVESFSPGDGERLRILRPATGVRQMSFKDLKKNYTPISADDAKASWVAEFSAGDDHCLHKASDKCPGPNCDFGKRTQRCNCLATNSLLHTTVHKSNCRGASPSPLNHARPRHRRVDLCAGTRSARPPRPRKGSASL